MVRICLVDLIEKDHFKIAPYVNQDLPEWLDVDKLWFEFPVAIDAVMITAIGKPELMPEITLDLWESVEQAMNEKPIGQLSIFNWGTDDKPCYQIEAITIEYVTPQEQPKTTLVYHEGERPKDFVPASESPTGKATWTRPSPKLEEMDDEEAKLLATKGMATAMSLIRNNYEAEAYELLKNFSEVFFDSMMAKHHLVNIVIPPNEKGPEIELIEREGFLAKTGNNLYEVTTPGLSSAYSLLGHLHYRREIYDKACWCYEQAYQIDNSQAEMLDHQARCCTELKDWERARNYATKLIQQKPDDIEANLRLVTVNLAAYEESQLEKDKKLADQAYQSLVDVSRRVLEKDPNNQLAIQIIDAEKKKQEEARKPLQESINKAQAELKKVESESEHKFAVDKFQSAQDKLKQAQGLLEQGKVDEFQKAEELAKNVQELVQEVIQAKKVQQSSWESQKKCRECGQPLGFLDRIFGIKNCKKHR